MRKHSIPADADVRFASRTLLLCDWIDTTNLVAVGGRGVAKSTVIIARRSERCVRLMPGAPLAIVADTYTNLVDNIMPAVQNGWRISGLREGIHYVKGIRPPEEWSRRCSVIVDSYKHVYSFWNGSVLFLGSLDKPSLMAGKSVAHLMFDEAKYASAMRASRVLPILRGDAITYGGCHLYGGVTITTDMPDVTEGEHDWFFRYAREMDPERIQRILQAADQLNRARLRLIKVSSAAPPDVARIRRAESRVAYWEAGLSKLRKGQTFFTNISSFANIDILTLDYVRRLHDGGLERQELYKSVLGMRPGLRKDARFYNLFGEEHKYSDGTWSGEAATDCSQLRYLNPALPLEGGMDFGNMLSLIIGQPDGRHYRIHKNLYTLPPAWYRQLADAFLSFFASHPVKVLDLYYDRSGNALERQGDDHAGKIKAAIEKDAEGRRTGWTVNLMSRKQANIGQYEEYNFMHELMTAENEALPRLMVDTLNCPELVSSIEGARVRVKFKGQLKLIGKDKRSEKLALPKLPRLSTNLSDAFKYLMMRGVWKEAVTTTLVPDTGGSGLVQEWADDFFGDSD